MKFKKNIFNRGCRSKNHFDYKHQSGWNIGIINRELTLKTTIFINKINISFPMSLGQFLCSLKRKNSRKSGKLKVGPTTTLGKNKQ